MMRGRQPKTNAINRLIAKAAEDPSVLAVLMFGSVARNEQGPASDVDICLVLQPGTSEEMSQKRLEYLALFDLDIHVFQQLPLYVRRRVLKEGTVLLSKDDDALYQLAFRTAQAFEDFRPVYQTYLEAVQRAGS
jgi:predicted nucleotidyltransferase